jgi:hypothetical protein
MKPRVRLLTGPTISGKGQGTRGPLSSAARSAWAAGASSRACEARELVSLALVVFHPDG